MLSKWNKLPKEMKNKEIEYYYNKLNKKRSSLFLKRLFDFIVASLMLIVLVVPLIVIAILIKLDSRGTVFYKQIRVTKNKIEFGIYKFRTMVANADKKGSLVTIDNDVRITKIGAILRKYRIDEIPQLINIVKGEMTFVGARPEVPHYVSEYTNEMDATFLLPAGVTSLASIKYKDEQKILSDVQNIDEVYVDEILPKKMAYNLNYLEKYSFLNDLKIMISTLIAVTNKEVE
ncbi:glycosyl transferase [Enterococcus sp. JM4C]|uniref:sugar transferase n=1 Tax=Candidatus Enterococcus huntleyi TaxID=1857217 RepID=UPI00137B81C0|nr:sugar transferase [Enterococcus sp. JM4C]KAF1298825.1 glycosyl transferase [Enterococcus sp. JM4C]